MRAFWLLLLFAVIAAADPLKDYRAQTKRLTAEERRFWRDFQNNFKEAAKAWNAAFTGGAVDPEATYDYSGFRDLYAGYAELLRAWGKADLAFAASGHAKAYEILFKEMMALCKEIDDAEEELADANPVLARYVFDQRPAIRRHGLAFRHAALIEALGKWPLLETTGWQRARRLDGKKCGVRCITIIDCLARRGDANARVFLGRFVHSGSSPLRVAATEALIGHGAEGRKLLAPLLENPDPVVRRALIQEVRRRGAGDPGWIKPMLEAFAASRGLERTEALAALGALTNQKLGYDAARWREWYEDYRKEIEGGRFDKTQIEVQEVETARPKQETAFYGIPSTSRALAFVVEGGSIMLTPAFWKTRRQKRVREWWGTYTQWSDNLPSHKSIFVREFDRAVANLHEEASYALVLLQLKYRADTTRKMLTRGTRGAGPARKLIKRMSMSGWCSPLEGLVTAARLGGADRPVDTVYLLNTGELQGGRYVTPGSVLAAFRRFNRFRRLVVHAIRIDDAKQESEALMKGFAEASGGIYRYCPDPP